MQTDMFLTLEAASRRVDDLENLMRKMSAGVELSNWHCNGDCSEEGDENICKTHDERGFIAKADFLTF